MELTRGLVVDLGKGIQTNFVPKNDEPMMSIDEPMMSQGAGKLFVSDLNETWTVGSAVD